MANIIIASTDDVTRQAIQAAVKIASRCSDVIDGTSDENLLFDLKTACENDIVIFDKLFLSYFLKEKLNFLRFYNPKLRIFFCELGNPSRFFGYRLHMLNVNGFIANIENKEETAKIISNILCGENYYPETIKDGLKKRDNLGENKQFCTEVSLKEMLVGLYLGDGRSIQEVGKVIERNDNNVSSHLKRLKRKVGYKDMKDLVILNEQMRRFYIGSWNDYKN